MPGEQQLGKPRAVPEAGQKRLVVLHPEGATGIFVMHKVDAKRRGLRKRHGVLLKIVRNDPIERHVGQTAQNERVHVAKGRLRKREVAAPVQVIKYICHRKPPPSSVTVIITYSLAKEGRFFLPILL